MFMISMHILHRTPEVLGDNNLALHGTINNNTPSPTLDLTTSLKDFNIAFAGEFVKSLFLTLEVKLTVR